MPLAAIGPGAAVKVHTALVELRLERAPLGVDLVEPPVLLALQNAGLAVFDYQEAASRASAAAHICTCSQTVSCGLAIPPTSTSSTAATATACATTGRSPSAGASRSQVDAYKRCRYYLDIAIDRLRPGAGCAFLEVPVSGNVSFAEAGD